MKGGVEMTLTIEYRSKIDGLLYLQFDADQEDPKDTKVSLFCHDDTSGRHDKIVSKQDLKTYYTELRRYMED